MKGGRKIIVEVHGSSAGLYTLREEMIINLAARAPGSFGYEVYFESFGQDLISCKRFAEPYLRLRPAESINQADLDHLIQVIRRRWPKITLVVAPAERHVAPRPVRRGERKK